MSEQVVFPREIQAMFSAAPYRRGLTYYFQDRVEELFYSESNGTWYGRVVGTEIYDVRMRITKEKVYVDCTCASYEENKECKHIVACMLKLEEDQKKEINREQAIQARKKERQQAVEQFIQVFGSYQQSQAYNQDTMSKRTLQVEYIVKTEEMSVVSQKYVWTIQMKIGTKRTYVVKDIGAFLEAVETQSSYFFTRHFTYDPLEHLFTKEDREIVELLTALSKSEKAYKDSYTANYWRGIDQRALLIPPMTAETLLDKLTAVGFSFQQGRELYSNIEIVEDDMPFSFSLDQKGEGEFILGVNELYNVAFFDAYGYILKDGCLYKLTEDQQHFIREFLTAFKQSYMLMDDEERALPIAGDQLETFLSVVLPEMKKIGTLQIAEQIADNIRQFPLHAKMYIERAEEKLQVTVAYHYGDIVINPFEQTEPDMNHEEVLIRDAKKEQEIMAIIEDASVKFNGKKLYVEGEEETFDFLYGTLPELEKKADVYLTADVKTMFATEEQAPVTAFDFDSSGNFLEVSFDMSGVSQTDVQHILSAAIEKQKYYRLPDGAFVSIEANEQFQAIQQLFSDLNVHKAELDDSSLKLPVYRALQLDDVITDHKQRARIGKQFRQLVQRLKNPDQLDFDLPADLDAELRDYQEYGFQWLKTLAHYGLGGILADDMGLGKTLQSITFLLSEKQQSESGRPNLIIAPASLVYNWKAEFDKFAPGLQAEIVIGTPEERQEMLAGETQPDVWITSYPLVRQDLELYQDIHFDAVFLDEAQAVKNYATKTSKAVRGIRADKRFALSGTPIENSMDELWAIFQVILPGFFPNQAAFRQLEPEKVATMVRPFILRRVKKDVLTELPDKIETTHVSELTKQQKELYLGYLEKIQQEAKETMANNGFDKSRMKILAGLTRLRQLCCHPGLFIENYEGQSGKLEQLLEIVANAKENDKRMLIFSQFTGMLQIIRGQLEQAGLSFFYLDGQTPSKERVEMVDRFNKGENDIFLISLKAGGTGLNLTGADTVILYDLWWNPAIEEQAAGRAHRIGQKQVVQVMRLLTKGTIEEKIYELQQQKKELIEKVIQPGETMLTSLSEQEIKELLSIS